MAAGTSTEVEGGMSEQKDPPLPPLRLDWGSRRFSHCQAGEDECDYEHCPRWQNGKLISEDHCALDRIGGDEDDD